MASFPWGYDDVMHALREHLLSPGAVTDGFSGIDVSPALPGEPSDAEARDSSVVVLFRWRLDPAVYAVRFHLEPALDGEEARVAMGVSTGVPVASLQDWVGELVLWLKEELDTGLVRRAAHRQVGGVVLLTSDAATVDVLPEGYHIGDVYVGRGGSKGDHLKRDGLSTKVARRLLKQDRLLVWLNAYVDNARGEPVVGHVVISSAAAAGTSDVPDGLARVEVLEVIPGTPATVAAALVFQAVRSAVEMGVGTIITDLDSPALDEVGFGRRGENGRSVDWSDVQMPRPRQHHGPPLTP